ncbi:hypothetical protein EI94DRAFT_1697342 [Lactarius quietus]|nr:hypothetical protein EI94DRAFT_1697342 [Lactarius quietus]
MSSTDHSVSLSMQKGGKSTQGTIVAWEQDSPGSTHKYQFLATALSFSEEFQTHLEQGDLKNVERSDTIKIQLDPNNYNPKKVLSGFMRGYFLMCAIFSGPRMAMEIPKKGQTYLLNTWSSKDGLFGYQHFTDFLFQIFKFDKQWTVQTIGHWNA